MPSQTFNYTGTSQTWVVPAGVTSVTLDVYGAEGGRKTSGTERKYGGYTRGKLAVTPGETLNIVIGQMPAIGSRLGGNGQGGNGGQHESGDPAWDGCGGGGASDVRQGGMQFGDRKIVGAGAGGSTDDHWFHGVQPGGWGGASTGQRGTAPSSGVTGGNGGSQTAGGSIGGIQGLGGWGVGGTLEMNGPTGSGGGGGAGYYGGGGGNHGLTEETGGGRGGGGGSNYWGGVTDFTSQSNVRAGNGQVKITWVTTPLVPTELTRDTAGTVKNPVFSALVSDSDATKNLKGRFEVRIKDGASQGTQDSAFRVGPGEVSIEWITSLTVGTYEVRAKSMDDIGGESDWTAWIEFNITNSVTPTDKVLIWNVQAFTEKDTTLIWNVNASNSKSLTLIWNIHTGLFKDLELQWRQNTSWVKVTENDDIWTRVF